MSKAGELLVQLDSAGARAETAKAQAQLKAAEADLAAAKSGGTHEELLNIQSQIVKARAERDVAKRNLDVLRSLQHKGAASAEEVQAAQNRLKPPKLTCSYSCKNVRGVTRQPKLREWKHR